MTINEITEGLKQLLEKNQYNPATIVFYEREWCRIKNFLTEEYGDLAFDIECGLAYLEGRVSSTVIPSMPGAPLLAFTRL